MNDEEKEVLELAKNHGAKISYACSHPETCPDDGSCEGASECLVPYDIRHMKVIGLYAFAQAIRDQEAAKHRAEVSELERQLAELDAENDTLTNDFWTLGKRCADYRKRAEQAEQRIAEAVKAEREAIILLGEEVAMNCSPSKQAGVDTFLDAIRARSEQ